MGINPLPLCPATIPRCTGPGRPSNRCRAVPPLAYPRLGRSARVADETDVRERRAARAHASRLGRVALAPPPLSCAVGARRECHEPGRRCGWACPPPPCLP